MKPQFSLSHHKAKLRAYSPRRELHGEDRQPAATLSFDLMIGAELLAMFSPTLRHALYHRDDTLAASDLASQGSEAANLRFPEIAAPLPWTKEIIGAELTIHRGISPKSDLVLPLCNVDRFTIAPQEGAVVAVAFRCACHPDEKQSGRLAMMIDEELEITLTPPSDLVDQAQQQDAPLNTAGEEAGGVKGKARQGKRGARAEAEAAFQA